MPKSAILPELAFHNAQLAPRLLVPGCIAEKEAQYSHFTPGNLTVTHETPCTRIRVQSVDSALPTIYAGFARDTMLPMYKK